MWKGDLVAIFISSNFGEQMVEKSEVTAVSGKGLEGDRFFIHGETSSRKHDLSTEITLIELEAIKAIKKEYNIDFGLGDSRRNLVTKGVPLNHLVDQDFSVGDIRLRGIRLCEPCAHLASLTHQEVLPALIHRGGLRAQIISGGILRVGDTIGLEIS
jgi:MOSC domain-containing protein YiiM